MANKVSNPYIELFEQLPIPERLEPKNIAAMLDEHLALSKTSSGKTAEIIPVEPTTGKITVTSGGIRKTSVAYRALASAAACAALVLGVIGYIGIGGNELSTDNQPGGGTYASDYNDVHNTFKKYYVDDSEKKTLDTAIEDIEHSYNSAENDTQQNSITTPTVTTESSEEVIPPVTDEAPDNTVTEPVTPLDPPVHQDEPNVTIDDVIPLPENDAEYDNSDVVFGDGFILKKDENTVRIITTYGGNVQYTGNIFPIFEERTTKTLVGMYTQGSRVFTVYSVVTSDAVENSVNNGDTVVGELLDSLYGEPMGEVSHNSVEICTYDILNGAPMPLSTTVQGGSLVDMKFVGGSLYLVTAYDEYRVAPIIGVDDLESYVPSYTVNGNKYYVQPYDIMIPDYLSNTDYTVITGINLSGDVSVKAVLGYEGRVVLKDGAVYLFGYDSSAGNDLTSVKVFGLSNGNVEYAGFVDIEGIALSGSGISTFGDAIAVTTVRRTDDGYITTLGIYDGTMNLISLVDFPEGALTTAKRDGNKLYLSGANERYGIDLSNPAIPVQISDVPKKDSAAGLVAFNGGYVTLTKAEDGSLKLAKIVKNESGELRLETVTTIFDDDTVFSKALDNNGLLFISGDVVGLPYGFFDGYDYCYKYALYRITENGFVLMGEIESHETDKVYENGKAILKGGVLYIFSDGRVSAAAIGDSLSLIGTADIVESAYSGHSIKP